MKKKLLIILLALTLVTVFVGCGEDDAITDDGMEDEVIEEEPMAKNTDVTAEAAMD